MLWKPLYKSPSITAVVQSITGYSEKMLYCIMFVAYEHYRRAHTGMNNTFTYGTHALHHTRSKRAHSRRHLSFSTRLSSLLHCNAYHRIAPLCLTRISVFGGWNLIQLVNPDAIRKESHWDRNRLARLPSSKDPTPSHKLNPREFLRWHRVWVNIPEDQDQKTSKTRDGDFCDFRNRYLRDFCGSLQGAAPEGDSRSI